MKKAVKKRDEGVSEVVGSILTLSITVVLFASIFLSMNQLPKPTGNTYANFELSAKKVALSNNTKATWINITHMGGESLKDFQTKIYLISSNNPSTSETYVFGVSDGLNGKKEWKTGETWSKLIYDNGSIDLNSAYVMIVDTARSTVIWRGDLISGVSVPLPPIIMDRGSSPDPVPYDTQKQFRIYVYVKDPNLDFDPDNGKGTLYVYTSGLYVYENGNKVDKIYLHHDVGYKYISNPLNISSRTPVGTHVIQIVAKDAHDHISKDVLNLVVGAPSHDKCDVYIGQIVFYPPTPVTGESTRISVTFGNRGNAFGEVQPYIYDTKPDGSTTLIYDPNAQGNEENSIVYISAHGESSRTFIWKEPRPAGRHNISVYAKIVGGPQDSDLTNNNYTANITILPKILLVDDDHNKDFDTSRYMKDALNATGYAYDVYTVAYESDDGPQYSTLSKYDVVIWMTGKEIYNSLTTRSGTGDVENLEKFLNNGGKLWLLGEGLMNYRSIKYFINNYMGAELVDANVALPPRVNGSDPALGNISSVLLGPTGYDNGKYPDYIKPIGAGSEEALYWNDSNGNHHDLAVSHRDSDYSTMLFSFEFSTIKYASDRAEITYKVLEWLSGISGRTGRDVAVGGVKMDPEYPLYKDKVNITINIRNNGWKDEHVRVQLLIDGADVDLGSTSLVDVKKNGGVALANGTWDANSIGMHKLVVKVDPYNEIPETDETNNVYVTEFMVRFRTLVVDDDDSSNNHGTRDNWTYAIMDSFKHLLSARDPASNYSSTTDLYVVNSTQSGPDYDYMSRYNAVIWVTGEDDSSSFTKDDMENIEQYLSAGGRLWIIGNGFINDLANGVSGASPSDISNFLDAIGIESYDADASSGFDELMGVTNDAIGHGIDFSMDSSKTTGTDALIPKNGANEVFKDGSRCIGLRYDNGYRVVVFTFNLNATDGLEHVYAHPHFPIPQDIANRTRYELAYLVMHWFGEINTNPEMKVGADLYVNGEPIDKAHIVIGNSYILEAKVHNVGSENIIYASVRFYDGEHIIGTSSVGVSADNVSTVSIIWVPRYAGQSRPIRVIVDYYQEVKEMPDPSNLSKNLFEYNNEIVHYVPVYFFWDDMENGTANWQHEATVVNINGESPLDFLNRPDVSTNVVGSWDASYSGSTDRNGNSHSDGIYLTTNKDVLNFTKGDSHSEPNAFWMPETPAFSSGRKPIDVIFVIDTSGSMSTTVPGASVGDVNNDGSSNTRLDVAIQSALDAVDELGESDRVAIFAFDQNGNEHPQKILDFTYVTSSDLNGNGKSDKQDIQDALRGLDATGGTPLYDTVAAAVKYMDDNGRGGAVKGLLIMTDGLSNSDTQYYKYAPGTGSFEVEQGPIQSYTNGNGLLNIPYSVMAISIAPDGWDGRLFPLGNSSTGNVSMALFESNPDAIEGAFTTFITLLSVSASTGGVRGVEEPIYTRSPSSSPSTESTISNLGAVVFSDGFRDTGWGSPGWKGSWSHSGFSIKSTNDGNNYYYKSQSSSNWQDKYWVAQTSTSGAYITHRVYPGDVLNYHYPGTYSIKSAEIRFWVGDHYDGGWWGEDGASATIKVYAAGQNLATLSFDGSSYSEKYYTVSIPSSIYSSSNYNIKIKVTSISGGSIGIDDVMVVYYIDYTPPSAGGSSGTSTGTVPADYSSVIDTDRVYRYFTTQPVDIHTASSAKLSFWTKYWMTEGTNGGVVYLWGSDDGSTWTWDQSHRYYLTPKQSYTGNLKFEAVDSNSSSGGPWSNNGLRDADGQLPYWCFNGRSDHGTFNWQYIEINLDKYIPKFSKIRIVFLLVQFGRISPSMGWSPEMGWYLDDVKVSVTSDGKNDLWHLENFGGTGPTKAHSGKYAWAYPGDNSYGLPEGVDASLITRPIDLTSALTAKLSFYIRFNINNGAGVPPPTIRVEVSSDNGMTWNSITYGVRIGWNASGTDTILHNGKSYSGVVDSQTGSTSSGYGWVNSSTLMRLNCDLSGYAGSVILIRIRIVTNATVDPNTGDPYPTYDENNGSNDPYGVYIDDFIIEGVSAGSQD